MLFGAGRNQMEDLSACEDIMSPSIAVWPQCTNVTDRRRQTTTTDRPMAIPTHWLASHESTKNPSIRANSHALLLPPLWHTVTFQVIPACCRASFHCVMLIDMPVCNSARSSLQKWLRLLYRRQSMRPRVSVAAFRPTGSRSLANLA